MHEMLSFYISGYESDHALSDIVSDEPTINATATTLELEPVGESNRCNSNSAFCSITKNIESLLNYSRRLSAQSLAVFAGIIHGLAGPGGDAPRA